MSRFHFKPSTVDRLRTLTVEQLEHERDMKRDSDEGVTRTDLLEKTLYKQNVNWDYGWYKRLTYLAQTGEVVAFNALLMRMDTAPKDVVYTIFEDTGDLHLLHNRYGNDVDWFGEFNPDARPMGVVCSLFAGPVGDYVVNPRVREEYDRRFYSALNMKQSKERCCYC